MRSSLRCGTGGAVAVLLVLMVSACGGGGDSGAAGTTPSAGTTSTASAVAWGVGVDKVIGQVFAARGDYERAVDKPGEVPAGEVRALLLKLADAAKSGAATVSASNPPTPAAQDVGDRVVAILNTAEKRARSAATSQPLDRAAAGAAERSLVTLDRVESDVLSLP